MVGSVRAEGLKRRQYLNDLADMKGITEYKGEFRVLPYTLSDIIAHSKRDGVKMPTRSGLNRWLRRNKFLAVGAVYKGTAPKKNPRLWINEPSHGGLDTKYVSTSVRIQSKHGRSILNFGIVTLTVNGKNYTKFFPNVKARVATHDAVQFLHTMRDCGIWDTNGILFTDKEFNHLIFEGYRITNSPPNVFHATHKDINNVERVFGQLTNNTYPKIRQLKKAFKLNDKKVRKSPKWAVKVGLIYMEGLETLGHNVVNKMEVMKILSALEVIEIEDKVTVSPTLSQNIKSRPSA